MKKIWVGFVFGAMLVFEAQTATLHVDIGSAGSQIPYGSWATAATNIQDAVDAALVGDTVLVADGVYETGGRVVYGALTNRVVIGKAILVQSVNGPVYTSIIGGGSTNGPGAVRCVWLGAHATLSGFSLINGHTLTSSGYNEERGGGILCDEASATVSDCVVSSCSAFYSGGGMYQGTANNCFFTGNSAQNGGGMFQGAANNCSFYGNLAFGFGGGVAGGTLNNCTLHDNMASVGGGAVGSPWHGGVCRLNNSILWNNSALVGANWLGVMNAGDVEINHCCTTPLPPVGTGNISQPPRLASASHLSESSPCIGAGNSLYTTGFDVDGEAWNSAPSMGCDEVHIGAITGELDVSVSASFTKVSCGFPVDFAGHADGRTSASQWEFSDGVVVSNQPSVAHQWSLPGTYEVAFTVFNEMHPGGVAANVSVVVVERPVHYVDPASTQSLAPYASWAMAATNIQDAIDATTLPGALVLVADGFYDVGGRMVDGALTNRVVVDKAITVQSLNGPLGATICGNGPTNGASAVRCVWLGAAAKLSGFTLTNGHTRATGERWKERGGGAVLCQGVSSIISNCVMVGNSAQADGGAVVHGVLVGCDLVGNSADSWGGAAAQCTLNNCTLTDNFSKYSGGADFCELNNCALSGNFSEKKGGAISYGIANNCSLVGNSAGEEGGGAYFGMLNNSILWSNTAPENANWMDNTFLNHCCTAPLPTNGMGNIAADPQFVTSGDFNLAGSSPCIDVGSNAYATGAEDLGGTSRMLDGDADGVVTVDLGCYEFLNESADSDGDRMMDGAEMIAGTSPVDSGDYFHVTGSSYSTSDITLHFDSLDSRQYQLFWNSNLVESVWYPAAAVRMGVGGADSLSTTNQQASARFYRLEVSLP